MALRMSIEYFIQGDVMYNIQNCKYIIRYQYYVLISGERERERERERENCLGLKSLTLRNVALRDRCIVLFSPKVSSADAKLKGKRFEKDSRGHTDMS